MRILSNIELWLGTVASAGKFPTSRSIHHYRILYELPIDWGRVPPQISTRINLVDITKRIFGRCVWHDFCCNRKRLTWAMPILWSHFACNNIQFMCIRYTRGYFELLKQAEQSTSVIWEYYWILCSQKAVWYNQYVSVITSNVVTNINEYHCIPIWLYLLCSTS